MELSMVAVRVEVMKVAAAGVAVVKVSRVSLVVAWRRKRTRHGTVDRYARRTKQLWRARACRHRCSLWEAVSDSGTSCPH